VVSQKNQALDICLSLQLSPSMPVQQSISWCWISSCYRSSRFV